MKHRSATTDGTAALNNTVRPKEDAERFAARAIEEAVALLPCLRRLFPPLDGDQVQLAAMDAVLDLTRAHACGLATQVDTRALGVAAQRNCLNILASGSRRKARERKWCEEVQVALHRFADPFTEPGPSDLVGEVARLLPDNTMRVVLDLWLAGEFRTEAFAEALGVLALPSPDRRAFVHREKARLRGFLRRNSDVRLTAVRHHRAG